MENTVTPAFSVYHLLRKTHNLDHQLRHHLTMAQISHELEDAAVEAGGSSRMFVGFQRFSQFLPQVNRYRAFARKVGSIFVFGIPDVEVPALTNVTYVPLTPAHQLSREWFVISYGRNYLSALTAEETTPPDAPNHKRVFSGAWTFNPLLVTILGNQMSRLVNTPPIVCQMDDAIHRQHVRRMIHSVDSVIQRIDQQTRGQSDEQLTLMRSELASAIKHELSA